MMVPVNGRRRGARHPPARSPAAGPRRWGGSSWACAGFADSSGPGPGVAAAWGATRTPAGAAPSQQTNRRRRLVSISHLARRRPALPLRAYTIRGRDDGGPRPARARMRRCCGVRAFSLEAPLAPLEPPKPLRLVRTAALDLRAARSMPGRLAAVTRRSGATPSNNEPLDLLESLTRADLCVCVWVRAGTRRTALAPRSTV
jgi:hypothetical protein